MLKLRTLYHFLRAIASAELLFFPVIFHNDYVTVLMRDHVLIHNNEDNYEELFEWVYFILVLVRYSIFGSTKIDS